MSGKSPYQGSGGKIPFFGNTDPKLNRQSIDPIHVGSPKGSLTLKGRKSSNYLSPNKPKPILKTNTPMYVSA